jgi:hypothetical protein
MRGREYWMRTSTGLRKMEHLDLEVTFGRRLRPVLRLFLELRPRPEPDPHEELHFFFLNEGRGVARHAGFVCRIAEGIVAGVRGPNLSDVSALNRDQRVVQYYLPQAVVHPNGIRLALGHAVIQRSLQIIPLTLSITWYAEEMTTRNAQVDLVPGQETRLD